MPDFASLLVTSSAAIFVLLGLMHLAYTFRGTMLHPREVALMQAMQQAAPRITRQTTMWRAWVGFNASHSLGLILFGMVFGYLALEMPAVLFGSLFLRLLGLLLMLGYVGLARSYCFNTPFRAVVLATALYVAGLTVAL